MNNELAYPEIVARFSDLWRSIRHEGTRERSDQEQQDLINQIRNALDRKLPDMSGEKPDWIADSFAVNFTAYQSETTLLLQLRHRDLGSLHALKTVPPPRRDDTVSLQRLRDEAEIGLALRHPCLVETSALLRLPDGRPGLLQPWVSHSLASIISAQPIAASQAMVILRRVLQALSAVHASGYVHCDVTPANILLSDGKFETARLGDFGIALQIGRKHAEHGLRFAASTEFAPPEQIQGAPAKPEQDIYAVGRLARRLIETDKAQSPQGLADFAQACCRGDPALRPQTAMEALQLL
ncbi:protein kinase domain-containing protein [Agrobacterium pusense]|uniref:protein kinase domain-containing protein n=1 Tax=Agrobacterium pusense TaxID=648995 RepID=UPI00156A9A62|nr:protein kinase [Agrobacterium pusense]MBW9060853.1 protein kinase [Agrobacterium pusense]QKJ92540.1 protein kinase [Agrobacterium pusense]